MVESQAIKDAHALVDRSAQGLNADCVFQSWTRDRQLQAMRELNNVQNPNDDIPDLVISMDDSGYHISKKGASGKDDGRCTEAVKKASVAELPQVDVVDDGVWKEFERLSKETQPAREAAEQERLAHPEVQAEKIEDLASRAANGDDQAKLDLRKELDKLMKEPNEEYREKVLKKMEEDGSYLSNPFSGKPHVEITRDENGKPVSVEFSKYLGVNKDTVPLNKTLEEQVDEAQQGYIKAMKSIVEGLGKMSPGDVELAIEILDGKEPPALEWFHRYRKEQGKPAVDVAPGGM